MPPIRTDPVCTGWNGSLTSYCFISPVPQHDTYRYLSSTDRPMSLTSGGTAPNPCSSGGSCSAGAGSAGIVMTLVTAQRPPSSSCQSQIDADRSSRLTTTPTNPYFFAGSCAGRNSSTIWYWSPTLTVCTRLRDFMSQKCSRCPYLPPSSRSGTTPSSIMEGVAHSDVTRTSSLMCHQTSYARYWSPLSCSNGPITSNVSWSSSATPPGPSWPFPPPRQETYR